MNIKLKLAVCLMILLMTILGLALYTFIIRVEAGVAATKIGDGKTAVEILTPAAYLGSKISQTLLAYIYACEYSGIPYNAELAVYWFNRSAVPPIDSLSKENIQARVGCQLN